MCEVCAARRQAVELRPKRPRKRVYVSDRDKIKQRGAAWTKLSKWQLAQHPICEGCGNRPAQLAAHVFPWDSWEDKRLDPANLNSLCRACHAVATEREGKGYYIHWREKRVYKLTPEQLKEAKARARSYKVFRQRQANVRVSEVMQ